MIIQRFNLNLIPNQSPVVVHVNQYDTGTGRLIATLYEGNEPYSPNGTAVIQGTKPDGHGFQYTATLEGNVVTADLTEQMAPVAGDVRTQIVVTESSGVTGTFVFIMRVQPSALPSDTDMSESDYQAVEELIEEAHEVAEEVAEDRTAAENAATSAGNSAEDSEAWAKGTRNGTAVPPTDPTYQQNSKYWAGQAEQYAQGGLKFVGTIYFASLPTSGMRAGDMYNIKDAFTTDSRFEEGAGIRYPEGTNVAWTPNGKWDVLAGNIRVLVSITLAQFNALTNDQKNDPTIWWWVPDANNGTMGDSVSSVTAYPELTDKPSINGHTIIGNMNSSTLEIMGINDYVRAGLKPNTTIGIKATAEGSNVTASGYASHGEGMETKATGNYSHSEGYSTTASGHVSHAGGFGTIAAYANQTAMGIYNDNKSDTLFEVGNGSNNSNRSNAFEVYSNGDINLTGNLLRDAARVKFNDWSYSTDATGVDFMDGSYRAISSFTINDQSWTTVYIKLDQTILNNLKTYQQVLTLIRSLSLYENGSTIPVDISGTGMNYLYSNGQYTGIYLYFGVKAQSGSHTINKGNVTVIGFPSLFFDDEIRKRCAFDMRPL